MEEGWEVLRMRRGRRCGEVGKFLPSMAHRCVEPGRREQAEFEARDSIGRCGDGPDAPIVFPLPANFESRVMGILDFVIRHRTDDDLAGPHWREDVWCPD